MLTEAQRVPVPRRPLVVVARDYVDRHAGRRGEDGRQPDDRRRRPERLREVDDLHAAPRERVREIAEHVRHYPPSSFSSDSAIAMNRSSLVIASSSRMRAVTFSSFNTTPARMAVVWAC